MHKMFAVALLGAISLAGSATAQDRPTMRDPFAGADANKDGTVTKAEMLAETKVRFDAMDTNHDGKLSMDELRAGMGGMGRRGDGPPPNASGNPPPAGGPGGGRGMGMGRMLDSDGDGFVSLAELQAQATRRFDRFDTNHDGKVDATERAAMPSAPPPAPAP
jgi:Ca2+-binding EF-hand superfamily protein